MIKNSIFTAIICVLFHQYIAAITPETERTYWEPWTTEHTAQWEVLEQKDTSISFSRRNEFFEDTYTLVQRDAHWETLCNILHKNNDIYPLFPSLGFAILDKQTHELVAFLRFNFAKKKEYVALSYGIEPAARDKKLGHEIVACAIRLINQQIGLPIITLKKNISRSLFYAEWREQGKKERPNFDALLPFFEETSVAFKGLSAAVDIINQPSLNLLLRYGMQPIEIACSQYYLEGRSNLFDFDIILTYPAIPENNNERINQLTHDILSRDMQRIQEVHSFLKSTFNIAHDWQYYALNREEKKQLKIIQSKNTITNLLDKQNSIKSLELCVWPYCFTH